MSTIVTLGTAVVGGSIGVVLTLAAGIPQQIRHHDRRVAELDEDLGQWVSDEMVRLERADEALRGQYGTLGPVEARTERAITKEDALHRYRDQQIAAERKRHELRDSEGWVHAWYRARRDRPLPLLHSPGRVTPLLNLWRSEVRDAHGTGPVSDPTKRSLEWALQKYDTPENREHGWPRS